MHNQQKDLASLIGSRICHDLISPLGAIGNGVELLSMLDGVDGPEIALINESVLNANARIRFFRIAFGAASDQQSVSKAEILSILQDISHGSRISVNWLLPNDVPRAQVKLAFLLLQCMESAMPYGGQVQVSHENSHWIMHATSDRMKINTEVWEMVVSANTDRNILPAEVHFALAHDAALDAEVKLQTSLDETEITLIFKT